MKAQRPSAERTGAFCSQKFTKIYAFSQCPRVTLPNPELLSFLRQLLALETSTSRAEQSQAGAVLGIKAVVHNKLHVSAHLSGMRLHAFLAPPQKGSLRQITLTPSFTHPHVGKAFGKHHNNLCSAGLWETHSKVLLLFLFQQQTWGSSIFPQPVCHRDASRLSASNQWCFMS